MQIKNDRRGVFFVTSDEVLAITLQRLGFKWHMSEEDTVHGKTTVSHFFYFSPRLEQIVRQYEKGTLSLH